MKKYRILQEIDDTILLIKENPELFRDGIDEKIVSLLKEIYIYIFKGE